MHGVYVSGDPPQSARRCLQVQPAGNPESGNIAKNIRVNVKRLTINITHKTIDNHSVLDSRLRENDVVVAFFV